MTTPRPLTIWCNAGFSAPAMRALQQALTAAGHRLLLPPDLKASNLAVGGPDPLLTEADVAFGQPDPQQVIDLDRLRWVHLTTAGYTRYDRPEVRQALSRRGAALTTSSTVYEEPCAEHVFAMILALARRLPQSLLEQHTDRAWRQAEHRAHCRLLVGQSAVLYGYGTIARRLTELLTPLQMTLTGIRRTVRGDEPIRMVRTEEADALLPGADHVVNILPAGQGTDSYFDRSRLARMKPGAVFYNIGRGTTVDEDALEHALRTGRLSAAFVDVTEPEPLPPDHPLWSTPNCFITPHTAGGHDREFDSLVDHFLSNLRRLERGEALQDRIA
jgi:phosphoglycerate dehydrogenase-like enzyme